MEAFGLLEAAGLVRPSDDPAARAAFLLANDLAVLMLRWHIAAVLDVDPLSPEGVQRWSGTAMDVYLRGVMAQGPDDEGAMDE